jgi:hypothetical protein
MFNGLQQQLLSRFGLLWSGAKLKEQTISSAVSKQLSASSVPTVGTPKPPIKVPISPTQEQQTGVGRVRLNLFNNLRNDAELQGAATMSTTTATPSNIFSELAQLLASQALPPVLTLMNTTLADIEANPQEWLNPAAATIKGTVFLTSLIGTLPTIENAAVPGAAQLFQAVLNTLSNKLTSAAATLTPASVGAEIANTVVTHS